MSFSCCKTNAYLEEYQYGMHKILLIFRPKMQCPLQKNYESRMSQDNYCRTQCTNRRERESKGGNKRKNSTKFNIYVHTQVRNEQKGANLLFNIVLSVRVWLARLTHVHRMTTIIFGMFHLQICSKSIWGRDMRILPSWTVVGLQSLWQLGSTSKIHKIHSEVLLDTYVAQIWATSFGSSYHSNIIFRL